MSAQSINDAMVEAASVPGVLIQRVSATGPTAYPTGAVFVISISGIDALTMDLTWTKEEPSPWLCHGAYGEVRSVAAMGAVRGILWVALQQNRERMKQTIEQLQLAVGLIDVERNKPNAD
jgi:hypothetical protein